MSAVPPIYNYKLHYPPKITIFPPSTIMYYILLCIISVIRNFGNNIMIKTKTKTKNRKLKGIMQEEKKSTLTPLLICVHGKIYDIIL